LEIALSLQLHAEVDFAGEINARFMALIAVMEVLVEGASGKKRHDGVAVTADRLSELKAIVGMVLQARLRAHPSSAVT